MDFAFNFILAQSCADGEERFAQSGRRYAAMSHSSR
jgi:hypothetical protein